MAYVPHYAQRNDVVNHFLPKFVGLAQFVKLACDRCPGRGSRDFRAPLILGVFVTDHPSHVTDQKMHLSPRF